MPGACGTANVGTECTIGTRIAPTYTAGCVAMTPKNKSIRIANAAGWVGGNVETSAGFGSGFVRWDWCGFADALFFRPGSPVMLAVQATNYGNHGNHVTKLSDIPELWEFVRCGHLVVVVGFEPSRGVNDPKLCDLAAVAGSRKFWRRVMFADVLNVLC